MHDFVNFLYHGHADHHGRYDQLRPGPSLDEGIALPALRGRQALLTPAGSPARDMLARLVDREGDGGNCRESRPGVWRLADRPGPWRLADRPGCMAPR